MEGCEEAHSLPAHAAIQCTITTADNVICLKEEARANCVGSARNQSCAALKACDSILLFLNIMQATVLWIILQS